MTLSKIEARKGDIVYCVYANEDCLPDSDTIKWMKAAGYKLYQDGRLYKPEKNKSKND